MFIPGALALALTASAAAEPVAYTLDPAHSWVQFEVVHFGTSTVRGRFGPAEGVVTLDRAAGSGEVGISVATDSLSTGLRPFDSHVKSAEMLGVAEYPTAWFVARQLRFEGDRLVELRGELTLHGVSQPLALKALHFGCYQHPRLQREVCGGDFEGRIKRSDFGIGYGLPFVADLVTLKVQVEGIRADTAAR